MGKTANPVDAHRKAQRAKELKKNKQNRQKAKEISTVKRDTRPIEQEIQQLSSRGNSLTKQDKDHLASLRQEVARINKAKNEYVEAHPEHRKYVFPDRPTSSSTAGEGSDEPAGLYDKNGRLKHPERSAYFDPVFNPFGAPPPGMPYREKPEFTMQRLGIPTPEELAAFNPIVPEAGGSDDESEEDEEEDDEDDDIMMPAGPPPGGKATDDSDSDSDDDDDDIPLPPGPPPPKAIEPNTSSRVNIPRPRSAQPHHPYHRPPPQNLPQQPLPPRPAFLPPPPPQLPPPVNAPSGPRNPHLPARPAPPSQHMSDPMSLGGSGPQRAFQQGPTMPPPPPPTGFSTIGPHHSPATISSAPSPFLSIGPSSASSHFAAASSSLSTGGGATISAAPQLRDLKKEATAFVPSAMRKKQQLAKQKLERVGLAKVDAARSTTQGSSGGGGGEFGGGGEGGESEEKVVMDRGPSLMESLKAKGVGAGGLNLPPPASSARGTAKDEDYRKFEEDMKEFL